MGFSKLSKFVAVGVTAVGVTAAVTAGSSRSSDSHVLKAAQRIPEESASVNLLKDSKKSILKDPYSITKWDNNWDMREPSYLIKPSKGGADDDRYKKELEEKKPIATRNIILIRHGEYNVTGASDKERTLTKRGIEQAKLTGQRLAALNFPHHQTQMVKSTMTRAQQTGDHIVTHMKPGPISVKDDNMLEEGAPFQPEPPHPHYQPLSHEIFQDGSRIEAAFRNYIYRADYRQAKDSYDLLVCHGNVIRYFACRALQLPPEAWLRIQLNNCSITWIKVSPNGGVALRSLGDCGHLPPELLT